MTGQVTGVTSNADLVRKAWKILRATLLVLLVLILVLTALMHTSFFQTWITQRVASFLGSELNTEVSVGAVKFKFFSTLVLEDLYVEDQLGDSLLFIKRLEAAGFERNKEENYLGFGSIALDQPDFNLHILEPDGALNLEFIIDYFASDPDTTKKEATRIEIGKLELMDGAFSLVNDVGEKGPSKMDFTNLHVSNLNTLIADTEIIGDSVNAELLNLSASEKTGFRIEDLSGLVMVNHELITLDEAHIQTNESQLNGRLAFKHKGKDDFKDFLNKVRMNHRIDAGNLSTRDLTYFTDALEGLDRNIEFDGEVKGTIARLRAKKLNMRFDTNTEFHGDITMDGLPDFDNTLITLEVDYLTSNKAELERIPLPPFKDGKFLSTPDNFSKLGNMTFSGQFVGFPSDFTAYGQLETEIGRIESDITLHHKEDEYTYEGELNTTQFDLGAFYNSSVLGQLTSTLKIDGKGVTIDDLNADVEGTVKSVWINNYDYKNIEINGVFAKSFFNGELSVADENIFMDFNGEVDFTKKVPSYSFECDLHNIDLVDLNIAPQLEYSSVAAHVEADGRGLKFEDIEGDLTISELTYCISLDECRLDQVTASAKYVDGIRKININSSIGNATLDGDFDVDGIENSLMRIVAELVPSVNHKPNKKAKPQNFDLTASISDFTLIREFLIPEITVSEGAYVHLTVADSISDFSLICTADTLRYQNLTGEGITLDARRQDSAMYFTLLTDAFRPGNALSFDQLSIDGRTENDTIFTAVAWESTEDRHSGDINGRITMRGNENLDLLFLGATLGINDEFWYFDPNAQISVDGSTLEFSDFRISNKYQLVSIEGLISEDRSSRLNLDLQTFKLSNFSPFLKNAGVDLKGTLNGTAVLQDLYSRRLVQTDLIGLDITVNDHLLGDMCVDSSWDSGRERLILAGEMEDDKVKSLVFGGFYTPGNEDSPLDVTVDVDDFDLSLVNAFIDEGVSDLGGSVDGQIDITGRTAEPLLNGEVFFRNTTVTVDYLNTTYTLEDKAGIYPDMFTLDNIRVVDEKGNEGHIVGTVLHENFKEWNYDIFLDISETPFYCLNTTEEDNDVYYGQAYATGWIDIYGYGGNIEFDINARTEKGTKFSLPLEGGEDVTFEDFITFVDKDNPTVIVPPDYSGITMNFELDVTPDAEMEIIFDRAAGDIMTGQAAGHLNLNISSLGDFTMNGLLEVLGGNYLFTLKNLINKEFTIKPGGSISWYGDPLAAEINLETVYNLTASLHNLFLQDESQHKSRVPVELIMDMDGPLLNPGIVFNIQLPTIDEITRSRVESILSSEQEKNRQAFALLVMRNFVTPLNVAGGSANTAGAVAETSSELLSSQLSSWLSQISDEFDIGFSYRPGDEISNDEIAIALSTQLFNDRLSVSGNFGVSQGNEVNQNPSNLIGDLQIEYKITEDGKIRLIVYNRSNEFELANTNQSPYSQGVGVLYKEEFDTMDEFYCGFKNLFRGKNNRVDCDL